MSIFLGIDLGTTFSAVAMIDDTGRPRIVRNSDGSNLTPSCVEFHADGTADVGEIARRALFLPNTNAVGRFKRSMGEDKTFEVGGRRYTATELSSLVLEHLVQEAKRSIGPIGEAVVTIPANFAQEAREATMEAARAAKLNARFIINEPTAAALYYAHSTGAGFGGTYAVYDLGGGTFDISIIRVAGQDVEVLATNGVAKLGGDDFDQAILEIVQKKFREATGEDLHDQDFTKNDAEEEKKSLSKRDRVLIRVSRQSIELSRREFEETISPLIAQAAMLSEATMEEVGLGPNDLAGVLLAGGSTRVPAVAESVKRVFDQEPMRAGNVDEVVAMGAALYAAYKGDSSALSPVQRASVENIHIRERTGMCFGTVSIGYNEARGGAELVNSVLIKKGEPIPCSVSETFYTVKADQRSVHCVVTESRAPETDPRFVKVIWEGDLPLPPGRPEGQEIVVSFEYDENQIMRCSFRDVLTGEETRIDLSMAGTSRTADTADIEKFLVE